MSIATPVVNKRNETFDIYIGRGSRWGNPFVIGKDGTRDDVVRKFKEYAHDKYNSGEWSDEDLASLYGKRLGCFCAPLKCHGDVLAEAAEHSYLILN